MNTETIEQLFGPMDMKYCHYFYFLSVFGFIMMAILLVSGLFVGITKRKGYEYYMSMIMAALMYAVFYFQNRLVHSMCMGTLQK